MRKIKKSEFDDIPRYLNIETLQWYLSVGRNTALHVGSESGAKRMIGRRAVYDREVIDEYMKRQTAEE